MTMNAKILIVDDRPENLLSLESLLAMPDMTIFSADSGNSALAMILDHDFALVLLDVQMPGMDGFETAEIIRKNKSSRHVPIIFITAIGREDLFMTKAYEAGAVDFLYKPINPQVLISKVRIFVELYKQKQELEKTGVELRQKIGELEEATRKITEQQEDMVKKERLNALLQMAGTTAHELNQPLMGLLGNIELLDMNKNNPEKVLKHISRIKESGLRISDIVKKIQAISHDKIKWHDSRSAIIDIDQ
ncbi:MAG: response regulator [Desulfobacteraceae bacterium]|jgi:two-component system cell cycle response regulator